jgi:hypothetical protein
MNKLQNIISGNNLKIKELEDFIDAKKWREVERRQGINI